MFYPEDLTLSSPRGARVKSHGLANKSYPSVWSKEIQPKWMARALQAGVTLSARWSETILDKSFGEFSPGLSSFVARAEVLRLH